MAPPLDVVVIGAGFAGLAAARSLAAKGLRVSVLEARDRVGGRTKPGEIAGIPVDLGGMWLGPTQKRLATLAEEMGVETYPNPLDGDAVAEIGGVASRSPGEGVANALEPEEIADFTNLIVALGELSAEIGLDAPWESSVAAELDRVTVETWLLRHSQTEAARRLFRFGVAAVFCAETVEMSMLWLATYAKAGGGLPVLLSAAEGGAQNLLFQGGVHQLAARLASELGDRVRLEEPVESISVDGSGATVRTAHGEFVGKRVIVAIPPPMIERIAFDPALPRPAEALHSRMTMGSVIKVWVAFERPYWRDAGLNGVFLSDEAPFSPAFDVTPPDAEVGILSGFFDADSAVEWSQRTEAEREQCVMETITKFLGAPTCKQIGYVDNDWTQEAWSTGCYGAYAPPGTLTRFGTALRRPIGPIHWAGTETATEWTGYIEGALQSGERAASEVEAELRA